MTFFLGGEGGGLSWDGSCYYTTLSCAMYRQKIWWGIKLGGLTVCLCKFFLCLYMHSDPVLNCQLNPLTCLQHLFGTKLRNLIPTIISGKEVFNNKGNTSLTALYYIYMQSQKIMKCKDKCPGIARFDWPFLKIGWPFTSQVGNGHYN